MTAPGPRIGFFGLGAMGGGMASNLVRRGFTVIGYDVYEPLIEKFVQTGGRAGRTPRETATASDVLISMVANAAQNESFLFDGDDAAIHGIERDKTFILCSTCPPAFALELRRRFSGDFSRQDIRMVDAPVSGGTLRAADGSLSIFAAGTETDIHAVENILQAMSSNLYRMGPIPNGSKTKTIHQLLAATNIISASEAMGLAATVGLNTRSVYEHVNRSAGASFMFENRVPHMLKNDWHPYSALAIILKDARIVNDVARAQSTCTPLAATAEQEYLRGLQMGMLRDDDARLVQMYLPKSEGDAVARATTADALMVASHQVSKDTIVDLLEGIHLAASVECMAFCKTLDIDRKIMYEIIGRAAGGSAAFVTYIAKLVEGDRWSLADCADAALVRERLARAVDRCHQLRYPCPMASQALQQYDFATLQAQ